MAYNMSMANSTGFHTHTFIRTKRGRKQEGEEEVRRHVERLLLRLDFNGQFSKPRARRDARIAAEEEDILKQGGFT